MRVLHVADRLTDRGGAYVWTLGVIQALAAHHEQLLVVGSTDGSTSVPCTVLVRPGLEVRSAEAVLLDDVAGHVDLVHVHNVTNPAVLEWAAAQPRAVLTVQDHRFFCPGRGKWTASGDVCRLPLEPQRCSFCFEDHGYFEDVRALTERRLAAARRLPLTVLSRYMREELVAAGVPAAQVRVVPPFVYGLDEVSAVPLDSEPCVLFVGRLVASKGLHDAIAAWRLSGVPLPMVVAGTGPLRAEIEAASARLGEPALSVAGWVDRPALARLYRRARALVFPPRWQEPFGIVGLEAMSFGVPVVAWESGGVAEWHPGPGLVSWGDVTALSRALREAVDRRVTLPPRFDRDETLGRLLVLYARVASAREPRPAV